MGARNNKLFDQKSQDPKGGQAGKETTKKKSCRGSKGSFQMYMAGKQKKNKIKLQKQLKNCTHRTKK